MSHHANDGSASRILRGLLRERGYHGDPEPAFAAARAQKERTLKGERPVWFVSVNDWPIGRADYDLTAEEALEALLRPAPPAGGPQQ